MAEGDTPRTMRLLVAPSVSGEIAEELLSQRQPARAYLAALDVLRPGRVGPMMQSVWPARVGEATVDLAEDPV